MKPRAMSWILTFYLNFELFGLFDGTESDANSAPEVIQIAHFHRFSMAAPLISYYRMKIAWALNVIDCAQRRQTSIKIKTGEKDNIIGILWQCCCIRETVRDQKDIRLYPFLASFVDQRTKFAQILHRYKKKWYWWLMTDEQKGLRIGNLRLHGAFTWRHFRFIVIGRF